MAVVYISIGSNIERDKYIRAGINALIAIYGEVVCSPVYESIAIGFAGDNFYNLVVSFETEQNHKQVGEVLSSIEDQNGRDRNAAKFSARTLDLDLLLYDDLIIKENKLTLPRPEIYQNAFVLRPLADIAADLLDPLSGQTFGKLWSTYDQTSQNLWPVPFDLQV